MKLFWKSLLAFSLSINLAGAGMVTHHWMTVHRNDGTETCPHLKTERTGCPGHSGGLSRDEESVESRRHSFDAFKRGCICDMQDLRRELFYELLSDEVDTERIEEILEGMGERQIELQRRLVEQIKLERSALSGDARKLLDEKLMKRMASDTGCCPGHRGR